MHIVHYETRAKCYTFVFCIPVCEVSDYTMFIMFQLDMQWRVVLLSQPSVGHQVSMWSAALFIVLTDYLLCCSLASTVSSTNNVRLIQNLSLKHLEMDHPSLTTFFNHSKEVFVHFVRYCTASISIKKLLSLE